MPVTRPCPPSTPVLPGIATFAYDEFVGAYPEFNGAAQGACANNFILATLLLNNCCSSPVRDPDQRLVMLYAITAHITFLMTPCPANNQTPQGVVGRVASATQGSVSVATEYNAIVSDSEAYFIQSKYGALFWQLTAAYRTMHYIPPPAFGPNGPGLPFQWDAGFYPYG